MRREDGARFARFADIDPKTRRQATTASDHSLEVWLVPGEYSVFQYGVGELGQFAVSPTEGVRTVDLRAKE